MASETGTAKFIRTGRAARTLGCSPSYLLTLARSGKIRAREIDGFHFFDKVAVEAYAATRQRHRSVPLAAVLRQSFERDVAITPPR